MNDLIEIGLKYETDKQNRHKYLFSYEKYMNPYREYPIKIFEIGIASGGSLLIWNEYLHNDSTIYGIDIVNPIQKDDLINNGCIIEIVNQRSRADVTAFVEKHGTFDIIIDDGDHQPLSQQMCLGMLFKYVNPGGLYIIEDLHTSYNSVRLNMDHTEHSTIEVLKNLRDKEIIISDFMFDVEISYVVENTECCEINRYDTELQQTIDVTTLEINTRLSSNKQVIPSEIAFIRKK